MSNISMSEKIVLKSFIGKTIPLEKLCISIVDCPHSTPKWSEDGLIVVRNFNIKNGSLDLSNPSYTDKDSFDERIKRAKPESGDIIITREAPMGQVCMIPEGVECCLGQRMVLIKVDTKKITSEYLLFALQSEFVQKQIKKSDKTGSIVSNLCIPDLKALEIPVLDNTVAVASILKSIVNKIDLNNRINAELEAMAKTLYDYWFVQFDFPDANGKPYKTSGGKMVYNATLKRETPASWKIGNASELFNFNPPTSLKTGSLASYIDMDSLPVKGFMTKKIQKKGFAGGTKFIKNDVAVARITPCLENGKTGLISKLKQGEVGFGSTEFIILRGKDISLSGFGACLARSDSFRQFAISNMTGTSGRKRIESKILETYTLPIPSKSLLMKFENIVQPFFDIMTSKSIENDELTALRDWLLPLLMNGQVTVK